MQFRSDLSSIRLDKEKEDFMRFLVPVIVIVVVIVTATTLQTHFSSNQVAEVLEATLGVPVYELYANKRDMKMLPDQETPLP